MVLIHQLMLFMLCYSKPIFLFFIFKQTSSLDIMNLIDTKQMDIQYYCQSVALSLQV